MKYDIDKTMDGKHYVVVGNETGETDGWNDLSEPFDTHEQAKECLDMLKLQERVEQEWEQAKEDNDGKDYGYYGLGIKYEIKEWVNWLVEQGEADKTLKYLMTKLNPLQFVYDLWLDYDDELWNKFDDMVDYDERWYKANQHLYTTEKEISNE